MPNRLSKEKAQAIAAEYCTNGFQKVLALLSMGYKQSYAEKIGLKLYDNMFVKQAIRRIQAVQAAKTGFSIDQARTEYEEARLLGMRINQPSAAVSAVTGKARLYGMDKDAGGGEKTVIIISPKVPDPLKRVESEVIDEL